MFKRSPRFQPLWAFIKEQEGAWVGGRRNGIGFRIIAKPKVGGVKRSLWVLFLPSFFPFFIEGLLLLLPVPYSTLSHAPVWPLTKGKEKWKAGEMGVFCIGKPEQHHVEGSWVLMAPGYPSGTRGSIFKRLFLRLYKTQIMQIYYVAIISVQQYLVFFQMHRRLYLRCPCKWAGSCDYHD